MGRRLLAGELRLAGSRLELSDERQLPVRRPERDPVQQERELTRAADELVYPLRPLAFGGLPASRLWRSASRCSSR
jgi:hypothetical protein